MRKCRLGALWFKLVVFFPSILSSHLLISPHSVHFYIHRIHISICWGLSTFFTCCTSTSLYTSCISYFLRYFQFEFEFWAINYKTKWGREKKTPCDQMWSFFSLSIIILYFPLTTQDTLLSDIDGFERLETWEVLWVIRCGNDPSMQFQFLCLTDSLSFTFFFPCLSSQCIILYTLLIHNVFYSSTLDLLDSRSNYNT